MTTYTFKPKDSSQNVNWSDPTIWSGGVVPNGADADVVFPLVTDSSGAPYDSTITVNGYTVHSIQLDSSDELVVEALTVTGNVVAGGVLYLQYGTLKVAGDINSIKGITLFNGILNVGTLEIGGGLSGLGQVYASSITNNSFITGPNYNGSSENLSINTDFLTNNGTISTTQLDTMTITVTPGGFSNYSNGTLSGGIYNAGDTSTLSFNIGGLIATDAADITLTGGTIQSFDTATGQYIPLTTSLHTIASNGTLAIYGQPFTPTSYSFGPLTVDGMVTLGASNTSPPLAAFNVMGSLTSGLLTVDLSGLVEGSGTISGPILNQGVIRAGFNAGFGSPSLVVNGPVTGNGAFEISPGAYSADVRFGYYYSTGLELTAAASGTVKFDNNIGTLTLDAPDSFTGSITPFAGPFVPAPNAGDVVYLPNTPFNSITGKSYVGDANGGTLLIQEGDASVALKFVGNYNVDSFTLSQGPRKLVAGVDITIGPALCFAAGTRIRVARNGAVLDLAVEQLAIGDLAVTATGTLRPIRWLGHRMVDYRRHPRGADVLPVRVAAQAFGPGVPARDLRLSPGHPVLVGADEDGEGGCLVPIMCLINGTTIEREKVDAIAYWHVELDAHDILLAEGLPAESYLDWGDRIFFTESADHALANPDFVVPGLSARCRPVAIDGPIVEAERRRLDRVFDMQLAEACAWPGDSFALGF